MEEELRQEWDCERNTLDINSVTHGSNKKVWWKCQKGHTWEASVKSRTAGRGCPYCAGKKVMEGVNDLATIYPEIAKEWDYGRNTQITPKDVLPRSHKKVWWIIDGKSKIEAIANRTINYEIKKAEKNVETIGGCKKVEEGVNDLATLYPDLASEWHSEKNGNLTPFDVLPTSSKKVWWKLNHKDDESGKEFTFEWEAAINSRTLKGAKCPYLAGKKAIRGYNDLATIRPDLLLEWDYDNNIEKPEEVMVASRKKISWRCKKGHMWIATVEAKAKGRAECPFCRIDENEKH